MRLSAGPCGMGRDIGNPVRGAGGGVCMERALLRRKEKRETPVFPGFPC